MIKHAARPAEVEEGVAFYGRTGNALMKSLKRLNIDPLAVYGTLCVKCPVLDPVMADPACIARVAEELMIVSPKMVVVMGHEALGVVNDLDVPLRRDLVESPACCSASRRPSTRCTCRTSTSRWMRSRPSASSGRRSGRSAVGGRPAALLIRARCAAAVCARTSGRRRRFNEAVRWLEGQDDLAELAAGGEAVICLGGVSSG